MKRQFKFTKKLLDALPPCPSDSKSSEVEFSDADVAGLRIVINRLGRKYFMLRYTTRDGRKRCMKLGDYPTLEINVARERGQELRSQLAKGIDPQTVVRVVAPQRGLTLGDFFNADYLPSIKMAQKSWKDSLGRWRHHIAPVFGDIVLNELKTQDIQRFHDHKKLQLCAASANRILAMLKRILNVAILYGKLDRNPVKGVRMHMENNQRQRYLTGDDLRKFLAALDLEPNLTVANYLRFLLATGVRRTEGLLCRFEHCDLENAQWRLPTSKNGRSRFVILNSVAMKIVKEQRTISAGPWVFPAQRDPAKHLGDPKKAFKRACVAAGLEQGSGVTGLVIHSLRHSFCSQLVQSGMSLQIVQSLTGHRQITTTARYAHLAAHQLHDAAAKVAAAMDAAQG